MGLEISCQLAKASADELPTMLPYLISGTSEGLLQTIQEINTRFIQLGSIRINKSMKNANIDILCSIGTRVQKT